MPTAGISGEAAAGRRPSFRGLIQVIRFVGFNALALLARSVIASQRPSAIPDRLQIVPDALLHVFPALRKNSTGSI